MRTLRQSAFIPAMLLACAIVPVVAVGASVMQSNVEYLPGLTLDLYKADSPNSPLAVCIHGGGWSAGDKSMCKHAVPMLASAGYTVAAVNYGAAPAMSIEQSAGAIAKALAYLYGNSTILGIRTSHTILLGHSAGAYYAALVALDGKYLKNTHVDKRTIKSAILLDCVGCDLAVEMSRGRGKTRAGIFGTDPVRWKAISPITYSSHASASFWMAYSNGPGASKSDALLFADSLEKGGAHVEAVGFDNTSHGEFLSKLDQPDFPVREAILGYLARLQ